MEEVSSLFLTLRLHITLQLKTNPSCVEARATASTESTLASVLTGITTRPMESPGDVAVTIMSV